MRSSGYLLCLAALASVGCADLLGLGDLKYDQGEQDDSPSPVPTQVAGDGDVPCCGGTPERGEDFPASFDSSAVWAATPNEGGEPYYWVYEPSTQTLSSFILQIGSKDLLGHQSWPFAGTLKLLAVVPTVMSTTLIGYDPEVGEVSHVTGADGIGNLETLLKGTGTSGRTAFLPLFTGEEWLALTYSEGNGTYRYYRPEPEADAAVFSGQWEAGWTSLARFSMGDEHGVIKHNRHTRRLAFDRFGNHGSALTQMASLELDFDASIVTVFSRQSEPFLLFYQEGTGEVATARFALRESSSTQGGAAGSDEFEFEVLEEGVFRGDLTQIVTLSHEQGPFAITFSSSSGKATLVQLWPLETGGPIVVR